MMRALAFIGGLMLAAPLALAEPHVESVDRIVIPVSRLDRAATFYTGGLSFVPQDAASSGVVLRLGQERIELVQHAGRAVPADSRSNDGWFQHLAIVVSDVDAGYAKALGAGATPISAQPQLLPAWNPNAGGIRAVYFRDPDGHPLELIQYPPGKGEARWQQKDRLFLGIDHTAIAAAETDRSIAFYRDRLGLRIAGETENWGVEQERLSAVPEAHVRITTLRADSGPGIELLDYLSPRDGRPMPPDTTAQDLWADEIVLRAEAVSGALVHDPDGHAIRIAADKQEASR
jgi:catechol 2,3-dioxygenase-like lactoylglutathione lyase family enzyme